MIRRSLPLSRTPASISWVPLMRRGGWIWTVSILAGIAADQRLGGHIVQGHVDGTGAIVSRTPGEHWEVVRISLPDALDRYIVDKGSIAVDGTSLTVSAVGGDGAGE